MKTPRSVQPCLVFRRVPFFGLPGRGEGMLESGGIFVDHGSFQCTSKPKDPVPMAVHHVFPEPERGASREGLVAAAVEILYDHFVEYERTVTVQRQSAGVREIPRASGGEDK
ncbi:MAG: hypothetical protein M0Z53_02980 [Thermaerobacter sp.]|nr:hypothetical protein [Thermaerobacter sp.]